MHACLNVIEIVRLIACELVTSRRDATAVGLACCCKSFEDPVLDALWETQYRLLPLLKSFPGDVWNEGGCTSFKRSPTKTEWARFRKYARRMRELNQFGTQETPSLEVLSVVQLCTISEPLLPNLRTLYLWGVEGTSIPFIPLFLSPRTTSITLSLESNLPKAIVASMITILPTLCPDLQAITLYGLPRDPTIAAAVSGMLLDLNQNTLQKFYVDSPLTEEANGVIYKLPSLCDLSVVIERGTSLPSASLPNLTKLTITCDNEGDWPQLFHGAALGKLKSVIFYLRSKQIGDFLGAFKRAALSSSVQSTLSEFKLFASCSWNPDYSSLLPFTQMGYLEIEFPCRVGCSSGMDDDIIINLSREMPKLRILRLGDDPCRQSTTGVTAKGLVALAHHCPNLMSLRVHLQVASLSTPPASPEMTLNVKSIPSRADCLLTDLVVGETPVPEESVLMVALTLLRIFPRISDISSFDEEWEEVENAINHSKQIVDFSRATLETGS